MRPGAGPRSGRGGSLLLAALALLRGPSGAWATDVGVDGVLAKNLALALHGSAPAPHAPRAPTSTRTTSTSTETTTTITTTSTTTTTTTVTSTTTTSTTTGFHVWGGEGTRRAFEGWLNIWRGHYTDAAPCGLVPCMVPLVDAKTLPHALRDIEPIVLTSHGGVASGVVTEGMGYGLMIEGFMAVGGGAQGSEQATKNGLALMRSWMGMVAGPEGVQQPFAGGEKNMGTGVSKSAVEVGAWPYGVSAIESRPGSSLGPSGVASWKYPLNLCHAGCNGSASDGDQDAVLGMIYLAEALGYPEDFVDTVVRAVLSFVSADLGFPDMYRTLPGGAKTFVPRMGSNWGGLTPDGGSYATAKQPWCYGPGYFAPAHYRTFRDFLRKVWTSDFEAYLPPHLDGSRTSLDDVVKAFDGAVLAGYNLLYYSSCTSGSVANWVGVKAECSSPDQLNCPGVPWQHTPFVGPEKGTCEESGTKFGAYGPDASRTAWRIAMDYVLFREESSRVLIYDRAGNPTDILFNAQTFLNRIAFQYKSQSLCDGGRLGECLSPTDHPPNSPWKLSTAFDPKKNATDVQCSSVPNRGESWWAGFMAYPTFAAFVAPFEQLPASESENWMETFAGICDWTEDAPKGAICRTSYFESSQAIIATMVMANKLTPLSGKGASYVLKRYTDAVDGDWDAGAARPSAGLSRILAAPACVFALAAGLVLVGGAVRLAAVRESGRGHAVPLSARPAAHAPRTLRDLLQARSYALMSGESAPPSKHDQEVADIIDGSGA